MSTGRPGANLVIPMGPLVAPADSDVLSVQRLDALNSSFHRGYMQQKQQAEANAKLPLIQAQSKVGVAQAKEELEDMQDPDRALIRQKGKQIIMGEADATLRKQKEDAKMAEKDLELREQTALGAIEQIGMNRYRVPDMANFLSKEGVSYDYNPNDPPEKTAAALQKRIAEYREFLQWSGAARAEWKDLQDDKQSISVTDKEGNKTTYMQYGSRNKEGPVSQERIRQLKLAQLTTFEQYSAFKKHFIEGGVPAAPAPEPAPQTSGYQPNVPLTLPPVQEPAPAPSVGGSTTPATGSDTGGIPIPEGAMPVSYEPKELGDVPAETQRAMGAVLEAPGLLRQIKRTFKQNRANGAETITFPGFKNDDGTPVTFDMAPIIGFIKNKNPWDPQAQALRQSVRASVSTFARGIFREVGVLSDADIRRYEQMLPGAATPEAAADMLFAVLEDTLDRSALMSAALNYDTKQGRMLAKAYNFSEEDINAAINENANEIAAGREARKKLLGTDKAAAATPEAAAASFVKQYGVQPPPPGWGLGRLKGTQKMIYLDAATGEYRDAIPAQ